MQKQRASDQPRGRVEAGAVKAAAEGESPHSTMFPVTNRDWFWLLAEPTVCPHKMLHLLSI